MKIYLRQNKAITLIALVISIVVILILAGVTIASLTGDNGLLARAVSAKEETEKAEGKERIDVEVMGSYTEDGAIDEAQLATNLKRITGITYKDGTAIGNTVTLPIAVKIGENVYTINESGEVKKTYVYSADVQEKLQVDTTAHTTPWVKFANNDQKYRVLYDANSDYGIEIISATNMGDTVPLGKNDPAGNGIAGAGETGTNERAIWSYTNAISTLNRAAEARVTAVAPPAGLVDSVRCVGSRPGNKNFKITEKYSNTLTPNTNPYFSTPNNYNGLWEQGEGVLNNSSWIIQNHNYIKDWNQMGDLNIRTTEDTYWLSSRRVYAYTSDTYFHVYFVRTTGTTGTIYMFDVSSGGTLASSGTSCGVRPVLYLTSKVKITGGDGTEGSPYVLE